MNSKNKIGLDNNRTTKIPPCGAINWISKAPTSAPVKAEPTIKLGIARSGSAAANGIAPSVTKDSPMTIFVKPASFWSFVNLFLNNSVATKIANGGTIPPAITDAITTLPPSATVVANVAVPKT